MSERITGLETEYGCLVEPAARAPEVLPRIRDWLFKNQRYGLIDLEARGWDEPAGNGGFLFNGGRVYLDMGHMEYCTPECRSTLDVVRYDRAGDLLLVEASHALKLEKQVNFIRNNIDHYTGATFGCHENYSLDRSLPVSRNDWLSLLTFLTLRILYAGAGRVGSGAHEAFGTDFSTYRKDTPFQLGQRADFIVNDCFEWVQHNRSILNLRDEPLADPQRFRRLHLVHGDTNVLPAALFLKIGSTRLALDLLEAHALPPILLADPVAALQSLSRTTAPPWRVTLENEKDADALEVLGRYQSRAKELFRGRDAETDAVLELWNRVLEGLAKKPDSLTGLLDWVTKRNLLEEFRQRERLSWSDPWLESLDLEYHHIAPERGLGLPLANTDGYWNPPQLNQAKREPPSDSRACARSRLMHQIQGKSGAYYVDWAEVSVPHRKRTLLLNPFET